MVLAIMVTFVKIGDQVMVIFVGQMEHAMKENLLIICDMEKVYFDISGIYCSFCDIFDLFYFTLWKWIFSLKVYNIVVLWHLVT